MPRLASDVKPVEAQEQEVARPQRRWRRGHTTRTIVFAFSSAQRSAIALAPEYASGATGADDRFATRSTVSPRTADGPSPGDARPTA
jgi:hypothetical protein